MALFLQSATGSNQYLVLLPYLLIFVIFYFLLLRPIQKQKKEQQNMLRELKNGDEVVTNGGIVGTIVSVDDERLIVRVKPDNIKLQFLRTAIASRVQKAS